LTVYLFANATQSSQSCPFVSNAGQLRIIFNGGDPFPTALRTRKRCPSGVTS
jgi:hypothetical protein